MVEKFFNADLMEELTKPRIEMLIRAIPGLVGRKIPVMGDGRAELGIGLNRIYKVG